MTEGRLDGIAWGSERRERPFRFATLGKIVILFRLPFTFQLTLIQDSQCHSGLTRMALIGSERIPVGFGKVILRSGLAALGCEMIDDATIVEGARLIT